MSNVKVTVVSDFHELWEAVYIDGKLVNQGHHCDLGEVFKKLDIDYEEQEGDSLTAGQFPELLSDVKCTDPYNEKEDES